MIVDTRGDILTALHVVDGASAIKVTFADGTTSAAFITASDPAHDIAVLVGGPIAGGDRAGGARAAHRSATRHSPSGTRSASLVLCPPG